LDLSYLGQARRFDHSTLQSYAVICSLLANESVFTLIRQLQLSIDISCPQGAQQQTHRTPLLLSIDGTDRRTDGRTDTGPFHTHCSTYYARSVNNAAAECICVCLFIYLLKLLKYHSGARRGLAAQPMTFRGRLYIAAIDTDRWTDRWMTGVGSVARPGFQRERRFRAPHWYDTTAALRDTS